ncbi:MAG: 2-oxoacid:ferredoxin oxidoreductase subunit beta [Deltaproteobacteria bacterium]|nr:2-oxoacid:ferredoxin oxidoreductase subunit beta [Deltaproteobacteria bacterium]
MLPLDLYQGIESAWCPGCGNFAMLKAFKQALAELEIRPEQILLVSGIGQSSKFPHYLRCHTFNGIHGRTLPVATGVRLANPGLRVVAVAGDGDCYGEGGNHLLAAFRRNPDVTLAVHNNQVYGLTKGQASPTSDQGFKSLIQPAGVPYPPMHALALAVAQDCSWVGRGFAGAADHLKDLYKQALGHRGFALLEVLQPCVSFNKVNTYDWYRQRVYRLDEVPDYDPENEAAAYLKAKEWGERIPIGVIYRRPRPLLEDAFPALAAGPLAQQVVPRPVAEMLTDFA